MSVAAKSKHVVLSKPPILEAIFEMRWDLAPVPNSQVRRDPAYPLMYGRLYDRFKKEYGIVEDLPAVQAHPDASPYVVRHRMRKTADKWPLIQVGPGVITVNEGKDYSYEKFRDEIVRIFEAFIDFYPVSIYPLTIVKTEMRFINGIEVSEDDQPLEFLSEKLHTKIELDQGLFAPNRILPKPEGITINMGFDIEQPKGKAILGIGSGEVMDKPAMLQQMLFHSIGENAPQDLGTLDPWLDSMHKIAKNWFETICRGDVMKSFV